MFISKLILFRALGRNLFCTDAPLTNFQKIMQNNRNWAQSAIEKEPNFFKNLVEVQQPKYLWIGCSDSRVPANEIIGLKPGEVFVHRNIANIVPPSDVNVLAVIQFAVQYLRVEDIMVVGHYGCGGIRAGFNQNDYGALQSWLSHIRQLRSKFRNNLIGSQQQKEDTLVELNITQQVVNVAKISAVQKAWKENKKINIHGLVYNLKDGILKDLGITLSSIEHIPSEFRIVQ